MSNQISVIIADAQSVFRMGLRNLLSGHDEIKVLGEAGSSGELLPLLSQYKPDILILDYNPQYFNPKELTQCLAHVPDCKVVIISSQEKKWNIFKALEFNVYCYLTKECGSSEILRAVHSTAKGEKFFCNFIVDMLVENNQMHLNNPKNAAGPIPLLTERELEITRLIAAGKKNKEIASELSLSPHTVHSHRKNILKKVEVSSALELTNYAVKAGILNHDLQ